MPLPLVCMVRNSSLRFDSELFACTPYSLARWGVCGLFLTIFACADKPTGTDDHTLVAGMNAGGAGAAAASGAPVAGKPAGVAGMPSAHAGMSGSQGGASSVARAAGAGQGGGGAGQGSAGQGAAGAGAGATAGSRAGEGGAGQAGVPASGGAGAGGGAAPAGKKFVGNITTSGQIRSDFAMYWDQITPENEGKWGSVEGTRNQMNWAGLDRVHDYAKAHGLVFKQHNFVWGSQQPGWLGSLSQDEQKAEVEEWIKLFCERYPDVALIDVVNEPPPHTMPVYMNALGGAGSSGYDWIVQAFKWAHQYCPHAILILNDYNNIEYGNDNSHFVDIVNAIKAAGAPIDAVGAQAHDAYKLPNNTVQGFVDKLSATGLPVYITEYDINLASDADQQKVMQSQFPMFYNDPHVAGITLWGYVVGATWKPDTGLLSSSGTARPALTWLTGFLGR
jgi:endo-1,4-beta-xylanase